MTQEVIAADREAAAKYADMGIDQRANAMADDGVGDPWELLGYFREKLRQAQWEGDHARSAALDLAKKLAAHRLAHLPNTDLSEERAEAVLEEIVGDYLRCDREDAIRAMQQYAAGLQVEVERLREALAPFADLGSVWSKSDEWDNSPFTKTPDPTRLTVGSEHIGWNHVTVGDLRRAYTALGDTQ